jgi:hypothetical protein
MSVLLSRELLRLKATVEEARDLAQLIGEASQGNVRSSIVKCAELLDEAADCVQSARKQPEIERLIDKHVEETSKGSSKSAT